MLIDLVQLRTFVAVAEEQHLTRAAERLHMSQAAASTHVRAIEEGLGIELFKRTNRNLELTPAGERLLRRAKALMREAAQFSSFARELSNRVEGTLVVGASSDPPSNRIGDIVAALRARHPMVTVDLHAGSSARTRQALKTGELDVGMFLGRPADVDFAYYRLAAVPYRIAGPVAWKARIETDDWAQLCTLPWLAPNDSSLASSTMLSQLFAERGLKLNTVARFDNGALGHALLRAGVGVMLMREEHAMEGEREGRLAVSPIGHAAFDLLVAHMAGRDHDPLIGAFLEAVKTAWPQMHLVTPTRS